jgi:hypothetical protein
MPASSRRQVRARWGWKEDFSRLQARGLATDIPGFDGIGQAQLVRPVPGMAISPDRETFSA